MTKLPVPRIDPDRDWSSFVDIMFFDERGEPNKALDEAILRSGVDLDEAADRCAQLFRNAVASNARRTQSESLLASVTSSLLLSIGTFLQPLPPRQAAFLGVDEERKEQPRYSATIPIRAFFDPEATPAEFEWLGDALDLAISAPDQGPIRVRVRARITEQRTTNHALATLVLSGASINEPTTIVLTQEDGHGEACLQLPTNQIPELQITIQAGP